MKTLRVSVPPWPVMVAVVAILCTAPAAAQTEFRLRGFADVGSTTFRAKESFTAVLGSPRGAVFGGGVEVVFPQRVFASLRAARFRQSGERVFLLGRERFGLGIPTTVTVTPVELTGGYRFDYGWRLVPYAAAGVGWHRYEETSTFADGADNVRDRLVGYQIVGGAEIRVTRWIGTAVEAQWATVPDAIGGDPNSVAREFEESDLGGVTVRIKLVIGR